MGMRVEVNLHIADEISDIEAATPQALAAGMEVLRAAAVAGTPVETGRLAGSASVTIDGDDATITYDGPYARRQHEELTWRHETGRAKYLELAFIENKDQAVDAMATVLKRAT